MNLIRKFLGISLLSPLILVAPSEAKVTNTDKLLIKNITIVSPKQTVTAGAADVYIDNGRILRIGKDLDVKVDQMIDGSGQFLTPGLIDSHTHLNGVPGMSYAQQQENSVIASLAAQQIPLSYLYHGFTTVMDLHSNAESVAQWNQQAIRPTAYFCGAAPVVDGYPMSFVPKPFRYHITPYFIAEGGLIPAGIDPTQHTPSAVLSRMKADGAICAKTHYEPGFGASKNLPLPSKKLIMELKDEAQRQGLKLLLHANSERAYRFGLEVGVDAFVHGVWHWNNASTGRMSQELSTLLNAGIKQGASVQPTTQVLFAERDLHNPKYLEQRALKQVLPRELIDWYASEQGQAPRKRMSKFPFVANLLETGQWEQINAAGIARLNSMFRYWVKNNGSLLFGSDTPSDVTYANPPGLNGRLEMARWQDVGVKPEQFLAAATIDNARFFNIDVDVGSVEVDKTADLLILDEDPRESIEAFDSIKWVITKGNAIERQALSANRKRESSQQ